MLLSKDPNKLQVFLDRVHDRVAMFGMHFAFVKFKMLLQGRSDSNLSCTRRTG